VSKLLIHATHEAGVKVGGIGAVLDGLLSAPAYREQVDRTICVGAMNTKNSAEMERLFAPRNRLFVHYFSSGGMQSCPQALVDLLSGIERAFSVRILYGRRGFSDAEHEILLVDPGDINPARFSQFQYYVWQRFRLDCGMHQSNAEFNTTMAHAEPALAALQEVLSLTGGEDAEKTIVCHEFMGLPLWYAAELNATGRYRSAFVAHEVATIRPIVESDGGHDTRFYSVMRRAQLADMHVEDVFGPQTWNFKHDMIKTAAECDAVLAVGDLIVDELRFLSPDFQGKRIDLVYNGTPSKRHNLPEIQASAQKLRRYAASLVGFVPNFVFSHVTRMVISKALWRDIRVMEQLDGMLAERGEKAVLFMLSSVRPEGRTAGEVQRMAGYGWPREHRFGWPDLIDLETSLYGAIKAFNATARASQVVLVNQFGFSRDRIGPGMPADLSFDDLRRATDLEFGQSIYEPFGIAQVEPLSSGALCVISDVCGCLGFAATGMDVPVSESWPARLAQLQTRVPNIVVAKYSELPAGWTYPTWRDAMHIGQWERDAIERDVAHGVAQTIAERLPRTAEAKQVLLDAGFALAQRMSWNVVAGTQFLPALS
jgi:hypothetical protein